MSRRGVGFLSAGAASLVAPFLVLLSGCGTAVSGDLDASSRAGSSLSVVASTNVYGDIVRQIAGDTVTVTSIVTDPAADPHSFEVNARNQLALSKADVIIENGGGYDDFIDTMMNSARDTDAILLNVVDISGKAATSAGELNEHVWYDFPSVLKLTDQLVSVLSAADTAHAATFRANAETFKEKVRQLEETAASIKSAHAGAGVAITEPVPVYLLQACGLRNKTPDKFSEAIEEGTDVPVSVLRETLDLFGDAQGSAQVKLLAYNAQTAGAETQKVLDAAKANGVAVVALTETLPQGKTYLTWMGDNLSAIQAALN